VRFWRYNHDGETRRLNETTLMHRQGQVSDPQGRAPGEEEGAQGPRTQAHSVQPSVCERHRSRKLLFCIPPRLWLGIALNIPAHFLSNSRRASAGCEHCPLLLFRLLCVLSFQIPNRLVCVGVDVQEPQVSLFRLS
jgi:hypothetical protein